MKTLFQIAMIGILCFAGNAYSQATVAPSDSFYDDYDITFDTVQGTYKLIPVVAPLSDLTLPLCGQDTNRRIDLPASLR
jgi:hypothetical protein